MQDVMITWWTRAQLKLKGYPEWAVQLALCSVGGLVAGFIAKNIGRFLIYAAIGVIISLWFLDYFSLIVVNTKQIKILLGVGSAQTLDEALRMYMSFIKVNIVGVAAAVLGFLIGWRLS